MENFQKLYLGKLSFCMLFKLHVHYNKISIAQTPVLGPLSGSLSQVNSTVMGDKRPSGSRIYAFLLKLGDMREINAQIYAYLQGPIIYVC